MLTEPSRLVVGQLPVGVEVLERPWHDERGLDGSVDLMPLEPHHATELAGRKLTPVDRPVQRAGGGSESCRGRSSKGRTQSMVEGGVTTAYTGTKG